MLQAIVQARCRARHDRRSRGRHLGSADLPGAPGRRPLPADDLRAEAGRLPRACRTGTPRCGSRPRSWPRPCVLSLRHHRRLSSCPVRHAATACRPIPRPNTGRHRRSSSAKSTSRPSRDGRPSPSWLTIPQRGLYTGVMILGAVGTGKTSACMYPYVEQLLRWRAGDADRKVGGLLLEVKGDFCKQARGILARAGRADDYLEISLGGDVCYNPLHNDLDPYAVAYAIASLLNNLFGKSKEPFWQQAYTDLLKFVILLRRITDGYTTLSEVYRYILDDGSDRSRHRQAEDRVERAAGVRARATRGVRGAVCARPVDPLVCRGPGAHGAPLPGRPRGVPRGPPRAVRRAAGAGQRMGRTTLSARRGEALVRERLEEPRSAPPVLHHRGRRRLPVAVRRQPRHQPDLLPAAHGLLRRAAARRADARCRHSRISSKRDGCSP